MDKEGWHAAVHVIAKSWTLLSNWTELNEKPKSKESLSLWLLQILTNSQKGYATKQIALALEFCKQLGLKKALITCNGSNIASAKTIIKNNGILENEIEVDGELCKRFWISL